MRTIQQWLDEYAVSHQNPTNKMVHWICVPAIFFSVVGLLYSIPTGAANEWTAGLVAKAALVLIVIYYFTLSKSLSVGMFLFGLLCVGLCYMIDAKFGLNLAVVTLVIFVVAWVFQFWGHNVEGKKPSFLKDIQFLMIGPAWVMTFIYNKLGIKL